ncbi:MAG: methyltransferase domain-containing protein [Phycisphaerales bacterium]
MNEIASSERQPHSAEFFNDMRDFWWNTDFLRLMAERLGLASVASMLDVGCGVGHWGRALAQVLPSNTRITGVDREEEWIRGAALRADRAGLGTRCEFVRGDAMALPFADGTFDMATCQTVLIHLPDPKLALREMMRVTKPGGIVLAVEPCNMASMGVFSSVTDSFPTDVLAAMLRFHLTCQRGKRAMGLGFNSLGDLVPGMMAQLGLKDIRVYMSDRASPMYPPYDLPHQKAELAQLKDWHSRGHWIWDRETTRQYYLAGGGSEDDFENLWQQAGRQMAAEIAAMDAGTYHCGNAPITYLVSGRTS